jgi:putative DNA primase/helicase
VWFLLGVSSERKPEVFRVSQPDRPQALELKPDNVPQKLAERERWVCWRYTWKADREEWTKLPIDAATGKAASSTDESKWSSFEAALAYYKRADRTIDGLGYVVGEDDLFVGIDLDDVIANGDLEPWAKATVEDVPTYWERSPSGTGLRGFGVGLLPDGGTRADVEGETGHIEMYETGRYLTVTGHRLEAGTETVKQVKDELTTLHGEYINSGDNATEEGDTTDITPTPEAEKTGSNDLEDDELLAKAKNADNGSEFEQLWNGSVSGYPSQSEADLALCNHLAFWTGGDRTQIDRLFRRSDLYRDKWDEDRGSSTYGDRTIDEALAGRTEFYEPPKADRPQPPQEPPSDSPRLNASTVRAWAGLGEDADIDDLSDRQKAAVVLDIVEKSENVHIRVRRDNESRTLWAYDNGIWTQEGHRALEHAAAQALGSMNYGKNVATELEAQVKSRPQLEVAGEEFGLETGTVAVENGLVFLEAAANGAGEDALRDLEPEDYALTRLPVEYDPEASYDEWESYVEEWAEDGKADALQEYVGYCLHIGALPIHRALLLVGSGANGKGTFLHVVRQLLGDKNTSSIGLQTLANEKDAVADFYGSLANIDDDLSSRSLGAGLGMFKKLSAGDEVRGRRLYHEGFEFTATGKHLYAANEVPQVDVPDEDEAFWRRWLLVEFPNHYPMADRDPMLKDRLSQPEVLSGVLNWAIDGWARLLEQDYFTGEERHAFEKRKRWQAWGDSVDEFISECVENDPDADRITTGGAWERYRAWCVENDKDPVGQQKFTNSLKNEAVGYKSSIRIGGSPQRGYVELGLSDDVPEIEETTPDEGQTDTRDGNLGSFTEGE